MRLSIVPPRKRAKIEAMAHIGLKTKIYLTDVHGKAFMGIGVVWLLQRVERFGSLRKAAEEMDLSYAKAHRMIRDAEKGIGAELLHRRRGGDSRQGAELTEEARFLLEAYLELHQGIKEDTGARFEAFLKKAGPRFGLDASSATEPGD